MTVAEAQAVRHCLPDLLVSAFPLLGASREWLSSVHQRSAAGGCGLKPVQLSLCLQSFASATPACVDILGGEQNTGFEYLSIQMPTLVGRLKQCLHLCIMSDLMRARSARRTRAYSSRPAPAVSGGTTVVMGGGMGYGGMGYGMSPFSMFSPFSFMPFGFGGGGLFQFFFIAMALSAVLNVLKSAASAAESNKKDDDWEDL